jgi:hypothetical protein
VATVRCENCGEGFLDRAKLDYHKTPVLPVGYPDTGVICGRKHCKKPGKVWLEKSEYKDYQKGEKYFRVKTFTVKVKVI